jgi:hypothetical protein
MHAKLTIYLCRDITEFGRNVHLPDSWHSTDRLRTIVWYHMMQRLKLAEFQAGDVIVREGVTKSSCCYWLLSGGCAAQLCGQTLLMHCC